MESSANEYVEKEIIQRMYKELSPKIPLSHFREFIFEEYQINDMLNVDNAIKNSLSLLYKEAVAAIQANDTEYRIIDSKKKRLDGYISDEGMLYLFATGIAIQALSLVFPPGISKNLSMVMFK